MLMGHCSNQDGPDVVVATTENDFQNPTIQPMSGQFDDGVKPCCATAGE
jgi:hypothetical protein